ncbi:MAG TPA: EamA family transporter RarD [Acidothermaceae bacterium]|jgi:chloramphenicol-sensitive protein RarD|nr:EamA family transporter RarD [Acidothermaceae bacterium]
MRTSRTGIGYGLAAYTIWGLFPLYWPLLDPTPASQILAHRMIWSLVFVAVLLIFRRRWAFVSALLRDRRRLGLLVIAGIMISINWGVYIWATNAGHVVEASLGYFITPLVVIALGVIVLKERLRRAQWTAVGAGFLAVVVISVGLGHVPWIALTLAASFGSYGLVKKLAQTPPLESMAVETSVMALPAIAFLIFVQVRGTGSFGHVAAGTDLLLVSSGIVTLVPLLCFAAATGRVPLTVMGLMQYVTPVLQFIVGVAVRHEKVPGSELAGFALVWVALIILGISELRQWRVSRERPDEMNAPPTYEAVAP